MGFVNPRNVGNARDMRKGSEKKKVDSCNRIMFALYNALWWILVLHSIGNFKCIILYLWNGLGIYVTLCFCFAKAKWNIISTSSTNIVKYGLLVYSNVENIIHVQHLFGCGDFYHYLQKLLTFLPLVGFQCHLVLEFQISQPCLRRIHLVCSFPTTLRNKMFLT